MMNFDIGYISERIAVDIDLSKARLGDEYFYNSLSLCVIDAVWSIGIRYETALNAVRNYANHYGLKMHRSRDMEGYPPVEEQESLDDLVEKISSEPSIEAYIEKVFKYRHRTSAVSGILKAEAVLLFAKTLIDADIHTFADVDKLFTSNSIEHELRKIPGQKASIPYFFMLAGNDNLIKCDRMIEEYLKGIVGRSVSADESLHILTECSRRLREDYPDMTPKKLDHAIWNHQRSKDK